MLSIRFVASDTPIARANDTPPLKAAATETAAVSEWMWDRLLAVTLTLVAEMPSVPSPSMKAATLRREWLNF